MLTLTHIRETFWGMEVILDERRWGCCSHPGSLNNLLGTAGGLNHVGEK